MKTIFHIDMDAYFATCHKAINPELVNKPVVIVHRNVSSAILTAVCYEARKYKIKVGMSLYKAQQLCDSLHIQLTDMNLYINFSIKMFEFLSKKYTKNIEIASIDEFYLDVSDILHKYINPTDLASRIQMDIWKFFKIPNSIGISYTKFLAKTATDLKKPMGISIITPWNLKDQVYHLPIEDICSIGKVSQTKLKSLNIYNVTELINFTNYDLLVKILGKNNIETLFSKLKGKSADQLNYEKNFVKSISKETSEIKNPDDYNELKTILDNLTRNIFLKLKSRRLKTKGVSIILQYNDKKHTKQMSLEHYSNNFEELIGVVMYLFNKFFEGENLIKLIGVGFYTLEYEYNTFEQLSIYTMNQSHSKTNIEKLINGINKKYQKNILYKGNDFLDNKPANSISNQDKFIIFK